MTTKSTTASMMAWRGDWHRRINERVQTRGFSTVSDLVASVPTESLVALASQLDQEFGSDGAGDVAAEQLERILIEEAGARGEIERCARDLIVRAIHRHLPEGWHREWVDIPNDVTTSAFRRALALSGWYTAVALKAPEFESNAKRVFTALRDEALPEGWLPLSVDDPLLVELFERFWKAF